MNWHRIDQGLDAGEDGNESEVSSGGIETAGAVAREAAPVREPAKAPFHHLAPRDHDKAFGCRVAFDDAVAHAVQVRPYTAMLGYEGTVIDRLGQARSNHLARVERREGVAVLDRGRDHGDREPVPVGIHKGHTLTPQHALAGVVSTRPAHADALDRLRIDDA